MESENVYNQMAQYDFKAPIEVTMILEENEEDNWTEMKLEMDNDVEGGNDNDRSSILDLMNANFKSLNTNIGPTLISACKVQENFKHIAANDISKEFRNISPNEIITENINNSLKKETDNDSDLNKKSNKIKNNNKENPKDRSYKPDYLEGPKSNNNEPDITESDGNKKHLNDLDNTTIMQINAKIFIDLLKTISEHLLIIIKEHFCFLQYQNDKNINVYTLDSIKHYYLRLKYHYFDLSYSTVSTILLPQEKNAGFIKRFLNHTLQLSKEKAMNCTYKVLETLYIEMISWVKLKKRHMPNFSCNENIMLRKQLLTPPKKIPFQKQQNTCIFTSGPPGRQIQISVEPELIPQNSQQISSGTTVLQPNRQQSSHGPSPVHQKRHKMSDKSCLIQPLIVEPSSINQNSRPIMVEPSCSYENIEQMSAEPAFTNLNRQQKSLEQSASPILQKRQYVISEPSSIDHLNKRRFSAELTSSCQQNSQLMNDVSYNIQQNFQPFSTEYPCIHQNQQQSSAIPTSFQQNSRLNNVEPSLTYKNNEQIRSEPSLYPQNRRQNSVELSASSTQQNIQDERPNPSSIHQLNKQQLSTDLSGSQQNSQQMNDDTSFNRQNRQGKRCKRSTSTIQQNMQPHPSLQTPASHMHDSRNSNRNVMQPNYQFGNYMNCNSHYNQLSYANDQANGRCLQQYPAAFQHMLPKPNEVPNNATAPTSGPSPPNYYDTVFKHQYAHYNDISRQLNDTLHQMRDLSNDNYNQEPLTQNQDILNVDTTRSSVSKDSGIMSPLCSETNLDQLSLPVIDDLLPSGNMTPMITHVTSLHPNAPHIIEGNCIVCQKSTNSKCLGCYKCYYCSHQCQTKDWKIHMYICRTSDVR